MKNEMKGQWGKKRAKQRRGGNTFAGLYCHVCVDLLRVTKELPERRNYEIKQKGLLPKRKSALIRGQLKANDLKN